MPHPKAANIWGLWSPQETHRWALGAPPRIWANSTRRPSHSAMVGMNRHWCFKHLPKKLVEKSVCFLKLNHFLMSWQSKGTSPRPYFLGGGGIGGGTGWGLILGSHDDAKLFVWIINRLIFFGGVHHRYRKLCLAFMASKDSGHMLRSSECQSTSWASIKYIYIYF